MTYITIITVSISIINFHGTIQNVVVASKTENPGLFLRYRIIVCAVIGPIAITPSLIYLSNSQLLSYIPVLSLNILWLVVLKDILPTS
jgi:hypothetical protein